MITRLTTLPYAPTAGVGGGMERMRLMCVSKRETARGEEQASASVGAMQWCAVAVPLLRGLRGSGGTRASGGGGRRG